ncbi:MAG: ABC transporter ATP-binding protein [Bacteroidales bacterium]|jgi:lipopolysaccharide transport system ATP-binding protein
MSLVIKVENLSKAYQIGQFGTGTLSQDLKRWWALSRGKEDPFLRIGETNDRSKKGESNIVWSLRGLNFEIEQGEAIGIIGKNGAGKSTLLKILSQVTTPTTGKVKMKGRVASLLEVGTGFHPELTGRENIFLNGAILGMRKDEITRKFDEIVSFSGVERYIDTPVKRYSSGMYVRLAFAVAAHLESEILVVDEVLAVGDAEFQKKCIGKMGDISQSEGRTVLFVSHNMSSVKALCGKSILLKNGQVELIDDSERVIDYYLNGQVNNLNGIIPLDYPRKHSKNQTRFNSIKLLNNKHELSSTFYFREKISFEIDFTALEDLDDMVFVVLITNIEGNPLIYSDSFHRRFNGFKITKGSHLISGFFETKLLPGSYNISLACSRTLDGLTYEMIEQVFEFDILRQAGTEIVSDYKWNVIHGFVVDSSEMEISKTNL